MQMMTLTSFGRPAIPASTLVMTIAPLLSRSASLTSRRFLPPKHWHPRRCRTSYRALIWSHIVLLRRPFLINCDNWRCWKDWFRGFWSDISDAPHLSEPFGPSAVPLAPPRGFRLLTPMSSKVLEDNMIRKADNSYVDGKACDSIKGPSLQ